MAVLFWEKKRKKYDSALREKKKTRTKQPYCIVLFDEVI